MDHAEEQENELMALEAIYMDDFKKLVRTAHLHRPRSAHAPPTLPPRAHACSDRADGRTTTTPRWS